MSLLYISGQMSGIADHNFPAFNYAAHQLRQVGYQVENPAEKGLVDGWDWNTYLKFDLRRMLECDGVATLLGWRKSPGARLEVRTARAVGIPVMPVRKWVERPALEKLLNTDLEDL